MITLFILQRISSYAANFNLMIVLSLKLEGL